MDVHRQKIVEAAARMKVPAMYSFRFYVEAGGLMSYGESVPAFHYRSASFVSRILRGARAGELAFERSTTYELVINQRAANALGTGIPQTVLFRADEVIK